MTYQNDRSRSFVRPAPAPEPVLPTIRYYEDAEQEKMRPELVDAEAQACANAFVNIEGRNKIKASQLRRFYGDVKALELVWETKSGGRRNEEAFRPLLPRVKLLKAKVAYAYGRGVVPRAFETWLKTCVDKVQNHKDFAAFLLHFEAVVGFAYGAGLND